MTRVPSAGIYLIKVLLAHVDMGVGCQLSSLSCQQQKSVLFTKKYIILKLLSVNIGFYSTLKLENNHVSPWIWKGVYAIL